MQCAGFSYGKIMFTLFLGKGEIAMDKAFEGMNKREELDDKLFDLSLDISKEMILSKKYMPSFMKDTREPFDIKGIGYTFFYNDGKSSSCNRFFRFCC